MNPHSLRVLEYAKIQDALAAEAAFAGGVRRARALTPLTDRDEIARRLGAGAEVRRVLEDGDLPIHGLPDLSPVLDAAEPAGAVLSAVEIAEVPQSLHVVRRLIPYLHERRETIPLLAATGRVLNALGELREEIDRQVDPSGEVRDNATPALRRIRKEQETVRGRVLDALNRIVRSLAEKGGDPVVTLRNDRYVVNVRRDRVGDLHGVVHGQSGSGASVYLEPGSIVAGNNELAELRSAEEEEIRRILTELTTAIRRALPELARNETTLAEIDLFYASGRLSRRLDAVRALPSTTGRVLVRHGRHPLLLVAHQRLDKPVVPLDLTLGGTEPRTLVITGPNTGGKTVALKAVGLFVLMNQSGLHVPAGEGTELPCFTNVYADIGDEQSIEASLSTFSSHMANINEMLSEANAGSLVLLDELGVGTDPEEGSALGKAILGELARVGAAAIVTTHYGSLKIFAHDHPDMQNASLEFDRESLAPTYRFLQGVPGSSEALSIAQRLGFPPRLVEEARALVGGDKEAIESLLQDLQERRRALEELQRELDEERAALSAARDDVERRLSSVREDRERLKRDALEEARRLVERSKAELTELLGAVRADDSNGRAAGRARTRLGEMGRDFDRGLAAAQPSAQPARPASAHEIVDGTPVLIPRMGWKGTALGPPGSNGKVCVSVGSLRVDIAVSDLEIRNETRAEKKRAVRPALLSRPDVDAKTEVHLRGMTVDEALDELEHALDALVVAGGTYLRVVHGKGTGTLRSVVQEQLTGDPRVKSFRMGEPAEGGSGVTIATLA